MPDLTCTVADILSWGPCARYYEARIRELFAGRERLTARDILDLEIPAGDRMWAVLRENLIPAPMLHEFACRCAERALELLPAEQRDPRSLAAIAAKRAWLRGEITNKRLAAAMDAARDAAWDAAWDAASVAASVAARVAAWGAQVAMLREMLEEAPGA